METFQYFDRAAFEKLKGSKFRIIADDVTETMEIELFKIDDLTHSGVPRTRPDPFSMLFKGPREWLLSAKMHKLEVEGGKATYELYLQVIIYPFEDGHIYEAIVA